MNALAITSMIDRAEREAALGCGLSDVLYEERVQVSYASILANLAPEDRVAAEPILRVRGYDPDFTSYQAAQGECSMTGIREDCCSCGRHP